MQEIWRDVPGFEGKYQINISTPEGRCRSLNYNRTGKIKELSNKPDRKGRLNWVLCKNKKTITKQAACWIALTYPELVEGKYFEGAQIDHIDTNPMNNHPSNLRWVTAKENMNNPLTLQSHIGKMVNRSDQSKKIAQYSKNGDLIKEYPSINEAVRETKICKQNITDVLHKSLILKPNGKSYVRKTAGGYLWSFL